VRISMWSFIPPTLTDLNSPTIWQGHILRTVPSIGAAVNVCRFRIYSGVDRNEKAGQLIAVATSVTPRIMGSVLKYPILVITSCLPR